MKYIRPSGSEIELEDTPEMVKYAEDHGWKKVGKRKRRTPAEMAADKAEKEAEKEAATE